MKRIFIALSFLICSLFLSFAILKDKDTIQIMHYDGVAVVGQSLDGQVANRDEVTEALADLAIEHDSLIVRRLVEPRANDDLSSTAYTYEAYGREGLPDFLLMASQDGARTSSLIANYFIVSGHLSDIALAETLSAMGYSSVAVKNSSALAELLNVALNQTSFVALVIFLLAFTSLTLIYRVKDLRFAGIRLISGESIPKVLFRSFNQDVVEVALASLVAFGLGSFILVNQGFVQAIAFQILSLGVLCYALLLVLISFFLSLIYLFAVRQEGIVELLKGKLPLKRLFILMLCGQFLALLAVGYSLDSLYNAKQNLNKLEVASEKWKTEEDRMKLLGSWSYAFSDEENMTADWVAFAQEALSQQGAVYVLSNLGRYKEDGTIAKADEAFLADYTVMGNRLEVSPSYLTAENVPVSKEFLAQMENLSQGQYGLVLPESLRDREEELVSLYKADLESFANETLYIDSPLLFDTDIIVTYVPDGQSYFVYNLNEAESQQYLTDAILVVMTPTSTSDSPSARLHWSVNAINGINYLGYDATVDLLKKYDLYDSVSYVYSGYLNYLMQLKKLQAELLTLTLGAVFGVATSLLLFNAMVFLYFEQFRRDIFIKKLAGYSFIELHKPYLLAQALTFILAILATAYVTKFPLLAGLVGLGFALNALVILLRQSRREEKTAITVLKGQ